jgi:hypothetical protein
MDFYRRVRPTGPGWRRIAQQSGEPAGSAGQLAPAFVNWLLGIVVVYSTLFGIGEMLFGGRASAGVFVVLALVCAVVLSRRLD